jgi:hypothetical protein
MSTEIKQYILLVIAVLVPLVLLYSKRHRLLLAWVCFTFSVQIFDTVTITNLPAGRIVGLFFMPMAVMRLKEWTKLIPVRAWLINYGWLIILGIAFGFIWPWPDTTFSRPYTLTAPGKTIIYLVRLLTDLSLTIFIAEQMLIRGTLRMVGRVMMIAATISSLTGIFYFITQIDLYYIITGAGEQVLHLGRARGLVGEPRALGLSCAYCVMILLIGRRQISWLWPALLLINIVTLLLTYSASSLALFVAGTIVAMIFFTNRERMTMAGVVAVALTIIFLTSVTLPQQFDLAVHTLSIRFDPDYKLAGIPPGNFGQEIAYRLDVFDACALLFLLDQPSYALLGTGPGLVSLPASNYVPPGLYSLIWTPETGINSPPYHGPLLEISNGGVLSLALWLLQVITCWNALRFLSRRTCNRQDEYSDDWRFGAAMFLTGSVFYLVQVSYTPLWCVFLAMGWVACRHMQSFVSADRRVTQPPLAFGNFRPTPEGAK